MWHWKISQSPITWSFSECTWYSLYHVLLLFKYKIIGKNKYSKYPYLIHSFCDSRIHFPGGWDINITYFLQPAQGSATMCIKSQWRCPVVSSCKNPRTAIFKKEVTMSTFTVLIYLRILLMPWWLFYYFMAITVWKYQFCHNLTKTEC